MAKYFLGSVGTAEAFRYVNGELQLAFVSKTLTDSGLNISTTKDDVRAGTGAPIQFSFYHDPSVEITLTDVLFDESYVEAQLGSKFEVGGESYESEVLADDKKLKHAPANLNMGCGRDHKLIWYKDGDDWKIYSGEIGSDNLLDLPEGTCVRYLWNNADAHIMEIRSDMIPEELFLVITAPIFAGDACSASNGKKAGSITYEVPRFKLNGAQEFAMNMSSNQTMSLAGIALASEEGCDVNGSKLLRIITVYEGSHWYDDVDEMIIDEDYLSAGVEPHIYGLHKNGTVSLIRNEELTFTPALNNGKWVSGNINIKITGKPSVEDNVVIPE